MAGGQEAERQAGAVGPVETSAEAEAADLLGPLPTTVSESQGLAAERRLALWWQDLGVRGRRRYRLGAGTLAVLLAATAVGLAVGRSGGGPPAPPVPWPIEAARVSYDGLVRDIGNGQTSFVVLLTVTNGSSAALTVNQVSQPYSGVVASSVQPLPIRVPQGRAQTVWVQMTVRDCSRTPRADDLPFIDVTLSNLRAIQSQSEILGGSYAQDLNAAILEACPATPPPSAKSAAPSVSTAR
ncbi:hypothetical protein ACEZCY_07535 [Streptacidiphilus sp. N1-12]|uniref:Tat pathway signal sequence domain protein n=2 Tax=Streptacidiphilus alkalitolerans TaxID=3342712 RepID=A0ABV6WAK1_9ACTN